MTCVTLARRKVDRIRLAALSIDNSGLIAYLHEAIYASAPSRIGRRIFAITQYNRRFTLKDRAMRTLKIGLAAFLLCLSGRLPADANTEFATLLEEHWEWTLASAPVLAAQLGDVLDKKRMGSLGERRNELLSTSAQERAARR